METSLKRSCLGALYLANSKAIQTHCQFKIAEAREKIFKLSENTLAVYSVGIISTNEVCPATNEVCPATNEVCPATNDFAEMQIQSGDTISQARMLSVHHGSRNLLRRI
jgi:hypothetical protein